MTRETFDKENDKMSELICCPICRRNDEITVYPHFARVTDSKRRASYIAYCPRCKVSTCFTTGGKVHTIYDAIEAWNRCAFSPFTYKKESEDKE